MDEVMRRAMALESKALEDARRRTDAHIAARRQECYSKLSETLPERQAEAQRWYDDMVRRRRSEGSRRRSIWQAMKEWMM